MKEITISKTCKYGGSYDVIVCGGGPAGLCAAISAAREGAKTLLLERNGELGGFWITGLLTWIADVDSKTGLVKEIVDKMKEFADGRYDSRDKAYFTADTERSKILFEKMCLDAGVEIRLYSLVTDVIKEGKKIKGVVTDSKSGAEYFDAKIVIDATGDGDVGALAGCSYEIGNTEGKTQPMSMIVHVSGIDNDDIERLYADNPEIGKNTCIYREFEKAGVEPSYDKPLLAPVSKENNLFALMLNHEYGASAVSTKDLTEASIHSRKEVLENIQALRKLGGIWENIHVVSSASNIGVREGRRIKGKYRLELKKDLESGSIHEDGVCTVKYYMDIHSYSKETADADRKTNGKVKPVPYEIPLRALIADEVDGLMMAGRCISGDCFAYGNFRIGGNAARTGEAAGTAAGYSTVNNKSLEETCSVIKQLLEKHNR